MLNYIFAKNQVEFPELEGFIIFYELLTKKISLNKFCIFTPTVKQICLFIDTENTNT